MVQTKIYPESGVELTEFTARNYDQMMNTLSFGLYRKFINTAIKDIGINPADSILDLGCGTGRNAALMLQNLDDRGRITGIDLSPEMQTQFESRFADESRVSFRRMRIDVPFRLDEKVDIVFISFVIHGFPHEVRNAIIENAKNHLKPGGRFVILDFAEFDMDAMPILHRLIFKKIECPYAFDYIRRDWKHILEEHGFEADAEHFYVKKYVRLLKVKSK